MSQSKSQSTLSGEVEVERNTTGTDEEENDAQASLVDGIGSVDSSSDDSEAEGAQSEESDMKRDSDDAKESLDEFGVEDDARPNNPKLDNPDGEMEADRRVNRRSDDDDDDDVGEQRQLFPDVEDDQATLTGDRARNQCLFE